MENQIKHPLQALGLLTNFFGLSTFFHNYFSSLFAAEERFFFTLSLVFAFCLPIPLVYLVIVFSMRLAKGKKKNRWERVKDIFR